MPFPSPSPEDRIPARGGVGLKAEHYRTIIDTSPDVGFFEVHAENYMGAGGPPHRYLSAIRERYPLSLHGVGMSIGADRPLDKDHIERLRRLIQRYSALSLLIMTGVIQVVVPEGWANFHLPWAALAVAIIALGPGKLSLDHLAASLCRPLSLEEGRP